MGMRKVVNGLAYKLGIKYVLNQIRAAAEGRLGPEWKARYWALAGWKTTTGLLLALTSAVLLFLGYQDAAATIATVAGLAIEVGLLDRAWRTALPAWLAQSALYRFLAAHAANLATIFSTTAAAIAAGYCGGMDCHMAMLILGGLAAAAVQLGLLDAAWKAAPPIVSFRFRDGFEGDQL